MYDTAILICAYDNAVRNEKPSRSKQLRCLAGEGDRAFWWARRDLPNRQKKDTFDKVTLDMPTGISSGKGPESATGHSRSSPSSSA